MQHETMIEGQDPDSPLAEILRDRWIHLALAAFLALGFVMFGPFSQEITELLHHPALAEWMPSAICFHKPPLV